MASNEEKSKTSIKEKPTKKKYERFKYDKSDMEKAILAVRAGSTTLNNAAILYSVPKSTLHSKVNEIVPENCTMGRQSILTAEEELRLEKWIIGKAELGFPMHPDEIKNAVQNVLQETPRENPFTENRPGKKWLELFLKRHPVIKKRNTEVISKARACVTEEKLREWFAETRQFFEENDALSAMDNPRCIFNGDETGIQMSPKSGLLLGPKDQRNFYEIAAGHEKENITVLFTFSAAGEALPPMIMYPYKRIPAHIAESVPDGWPIGRSDSGWMVSASFYEYVANIFYPWLLANNVPFPVVFYLDGHKSHLNERLAEFCLEHQIILYCLPPNATHIMQPCDVSVFKALKAHWRTAVHEHKQTTQKSITKSNFAPTLKLAFDKFLENTEVIKNGFKRCGLYPFDDNAPEYTKCISRRRRDIFDQPEADDSQVSGNDFSVARKVLEEVIGPSKCETFLNMRNSNEYSKDSLYLFWKICFDRASGLVSQDDYEAVRATISLDPALESLQSIDANCDSTIIDHEEGVLSYPFEETSNVTGLETESCDEPTGVVVFPERISENVIGGNNSAQSIPVIAEEDIEYEILSQNINGDVVRFEVIDDLIVNNENYDSNENLKNFNDIQIETTNRDENEVTRMDENGNKSVDEVEDALDRENENSEKSKHDENGNGNLNRTNEQNQQVQTIVIAKKKEGTSVEWDKHLHWPDPQNKETSKAAKKPMPYALTSQKWKEHFELQRQREIEKVKIAAEKLEMRRLKKEADEKAAAERVEMKRLKKEAADAAKAEKIKSKEEMAKLRAESRKIKQEQGNQRRRKNTKSDKGLITPVHPIVSTEDVTTGETGSIDETPKTPRKREIDMKKRSNEPIPKASKEE